MQNRTQFLNREEKILATAEQLLLESGDGDLTLDDLASNLALAKGTLYKHFDSKDELYLRILIRYEHKLFTINCIDDSESATIARMILQILLYPRRAMLFNLLEERLTDSTSTPKRLFDELYRIRRERMNRLLEIVSRYLEQQNSTMSARDYLSSLWALGQGGASLLNSSFYQRYLGRRDTLMLSLVSQALALPQLAKSSEKKTVDKKAPAQKKVDEFSPFGKLTPPTL